jgi:pimeloyl-ACP methyl ester carboxylesterase
MAMDRAPVEGIELEYELRGSGEPVVLIHWGVASVFAEPLLDEPALVDYRLLSYHRAGFGASGRVDGPLTMADHARHWRALMGHLGIDRAHIVGHSSSATIALQFALDFPAAAVDTFFRGVFGEGYGPALEEGLPGAVEQAVAEADAFFTQELPALQQWPFGEDDASRITQPVLLVLGENSTPTFPERRELLLSWLPNAEPCDIADTRHLLHVEHPAAVAEALAGFFARHPLA